MGAGRRGGGRGKEGLVPFSRGPRPRKPRPPHARKRWEKESKKKGGEKAARRLWVKGRRGVARPTAPTLIIPTHTQLNWAASVDPLSASVEEAPAETTVEMASK